MKIAFIANTRVDETEDQVEFDPPHTINLVKDAIESTENEFVFLEANDKIFEELKTNKPDLVLNRAEGIRGSSRESHIPAMLEMLNIPYVGSDVLTTAICLNKEWTKKLISYHGIKTPNFTILEQNKKFDYNSLKNLVDFPIILKPNIEGSSIGINEDNVVNDEDSLKIKLNTLFNQYNQPILVEKFISGREFSTGVIGTNKRNLEILPIIEINFSNMPDDVENVFGQRAKTKYDDLANYTCPAQIHKDLEAELKRITIKICDILKIKDFARLDFRMNSDNEIFFLEVNPLPGIDYNPEEKDISFYPLMALKAGFTYEDMIKRILNSASSRYGLSL